MIEPLLIGLGAWFGLSVPVAIAIGHWLRRLERQGKVA
jgi:hypothetical protein